MMNPLRAVVMSVALTVAALATAPTSAAGMQVGNYDMNITGRYDFHTWIWAVASCSTGGECVHVTTIGLPVAKASTFREDVLLVDGRYAMTVEDPFGLRCGNVYYGPTIPTTDIYSWDAVNLTGTLTSAFPVGCNGEPAGTYTYPIALVRR
jgi:hypothetical protein